MGRSTHMVAGPAIKHNKKSIWSLRRGSVEGLTGGRALWRGSAEELSGAALKRGSEEGHSGGGSAEGL
eukprot:9458978-Alexandrium_andersonii.AAC.1